MRKWKSSTVKPLLMVGSADFDNGVFQGELQFVPKQDRPKRKHGPKEWVRKVRDRRICQCCGFLYKHTEIHHIQPLCFGGIDEANNMICLCSICHKYAPDNPDKFLEYQKSGGKVWQDVVAKMIGGLDSVGSIGSLEDVIKASKALRYHCFGLCTDDNIPDDEELDLMLDRML